VSETGEWGGIDKLVFGRGNIVVDEAVVVGVGVMVILERVKKSVGVVAIKQSLSSDSEEKSGMREGRGGNRQERLRSSWSPNDREVPTIASARGCIVMPLCDLEERRGVPGTVGEVSSKA